MSITLARISGYVAMVAQNLANNPNKNASIMDRFVEDDDDDDDLACSK